MTPEQIQQIKKFAQTLNLGDSTHTTNMVAIALNAIYKGCNNAVEDVTIYAKLTEIKLTQEQLSELIKKTIALILKTMTV